MPRLFDTLLTSPKYANISDCQYICIDNVAHYIFDDYMSRQINMSDCPNLAPPFDRFFMQFRLPNTIVINSERVQRRAMDIEIGVYFMYLDLQCDREELLGVIRKIDGECDGLLEKMWSIDHRWLMLSIVFEMRDGRCYEQMHEYVFVYADGRAQEAGSSVPIGMTEGDVARMRELNLSPAFFAISLLHCKNVLLDEVTPSRALSKKHQKRHGRPLETFHVLNIAPMTRILRQDGSCEKTGLKQALHICRGHFKDYRNSAGLFGKYKGLFWWDNQVRGSHAAGVVDKDYNVIASNG